MTVVEIAGIGPGPFCGMLLADLGADVIVVERSADSVPRSRPAHIVGRGKRSVELDLKHPDAAEIVLRLVQRSDALIEGMRPGVMERLGLGPADCHARNPALVYGRMTGWGQHGPFAQSAGHDPNYAALAGALWYAGPPGAPPLTPPTVVGDIGGGALYLAIGLLGGILRARSTGLGTVVDAAIVDGAAHASNLLLSIIATSGGDFSRNTSFIDIAPWNGRSYRCADGGWINAASLEPQFYHEFIRLLGVDGDAQVAEGHHKPASWPYVISVIEQRFATRTRDEWAAVFAGTDACVAPILSPAEAAVHPHMAERGTFVTVDGVLQAAPAPRFSTAEPPRPASVPPRGRDTLSVLGELGFTAEQIEGWKHTGVVGFPGDAGARE